MKTAPSTAPKHTLDLEIEVRQVKILWHGWRSFVERSLARRTALESALPKKHSRFLLYAASFGVLAADRVRWIERGSGAAGASGIGVPVLALREA